MPETLYAIRPGMRGRTDEWGRIVVLRQRAGRVYFQASGGRGRPGVYMSTRSILFAATAWGYDA
jgi:hypothetical protein